MKTINAIFNLVLFFGGIYAAWKLWDYIFIMKFVWFGFFIIGLLVYCGSSFFSKK